MTIPPPSAEFPGSASKTARPLWWSVGLLLVLAAGLLLFARGLSRIDEGRYAETAREMIVSGGDFWQMRLMGVRYYEKPPMLYWMSAASMKIWGVADATARLPLLLSVVVTLALCYRWARREWNLAAARIGLATLLSSTGILVGMSFLLTDPVLVMFFSATCFFLYEAYRPGEGRRRRWLLAAAVAAWGGVLTKGFVAIVLPGAILFFWLLWERRLRDLWRWSLIPIGLLFTATLAAVLWHIEQHNPEFNYRFIVQEHFQRFLGTRAIQGHPESPLFFIPVLPALLFPWVFFVPRAIRGIRTNGDLKNDSFSRFLVVWAVAVFLFFSASSGKLMSYIMPMIPPMGLLIMRRGLLPVRSAADSVDRRLWAIGASLPLLCPVAVAVFWALARTGVIDDSFGPPPWALVTPVVAGLGILVWVWIRGLWKTVPGLLLAAATAYATLAILLSPLAGPDFLAGIEDDRVFYREVARQVGPGDELVLCKKHNPALAFYLGRVPWMYRVDNELAAGMQMEPGRPGIFQNYSELKAAMSADPGRIYYAVLLPEHAEKLVQEGLRFFPGILARDREMVLVRFMTP